VSLRVPTALLAGLLAVPILLLYMLKLRRRQVQVSSTLLWQMLLRDRQANTPWQRLKRNLLLFLQLLILAALVFALARPALKVHSVAGGSLVVLLDGSASMNAYNLPSSGNSVQSGALQSGLQRQGDQTRFETARAVVRNLIYSLPEDSRMTLILVSSQHRTLASAEDDKTELTQALESAQPSNSIANWEAAFALAAGASSSLGGINGPAGDGTSIVIVSDGGLPKQGLPPLPGEVRYIPVGQGSENLAVSALALRPSPSGLELFTQVTNYGDLEQQTILSIYSGNRLIKAQQMNVPAGGQKNLTLEGLPDQKSSYEARLSAPSQDQGGSAFLASQDIFALDDRAFSVYNPSAIARTLLVTQKNIFLDQLLSSLPGIEPFRALPGEDQVLKLPNEPFDIYVLDGFYPDKDAVSRIAHSNLLLINPPANDLFEVGGTFTTTTAAQVTNNPLTEFVDWKNVHVLKARQITPPRWADVLVDTPSGPLVFAGENSGQRIAVLTFDLHDSDLPLQVAYPILFSNLFQYLTKSRSVQISSPIGGVHPNDSVLIRPQDSIKGINVQDPSGKLFSPNVNENGAVFSGTGELGIYTVSSTGSETLTETVSTVQDAFAVNLFSPLESDLHTEETIQVGNSPVAASRRAEIGQREYWPWLAALALGLLLIEWWLYHRQM
jgi:Ca-activated chloride channel family protein